MVTLQKIGGDMNRNVLEITGLSTDEKPVEFIETTYITNGSTYEVCISTGCPFLSGMKAENIVFPLSGSI